MLYVYCVMSILMVCQRLKSGLFYNFKYSTNVSLTLLMKQLATLASCKAAAKMLCGSASRVS